VEHRRLSSANEADNENAPASISRIGDLNGTAPDSSGGGDENQQRRCLSEVKGKVGVDIAKYLSSSLPYALYLDHVLQQCTHSVALATCNTIDDDDDDDREAAAQLQPQRQCQPNTQRYVTSDSIRFPTDVLDMILGHQLLGLDAVCRVLSTMTRPKISAYYEHCKALPHFQSILKPRLLFLIGRLLHKYHQRQIYQSATTATAGVFRFDWKEWIRLVGGMGGDSSSGSREDEHNDRSKNSSSSSGDGGSSTNNDGEIGIGAGPRQRYEDSSLRLAIKSDVSEALSVLISSLLLEE